MKAAGAAVKRGRPFDRKRSWSISAGRLVTIGASGNRTVASRSALRLRPDPRWDKQLFRRYGCGFAFLADENHQDLGRYVAPIEKLVLVIESLDVGLPGFVLMQLSAVTLQLHLALEDIHVGRYGMLMQWRAAARLDDPNDGDHLWRVRLRIGDRLLVSSLNRLQQRLSLEPGRQRTILGKHCRGSGHEPDGGERASS